MKFHLYCIMYQYLILLIDKKYFFMWIYHILFLYQLLNIWFASNLEFWWIKLLWTFVYRFLCSYVYVKVLVWTYVFISLGYIPRSRIAGSNGNLMNNFLRHCQTVFQSGCTNYIWYVYLYIYMSNVWKSIFLHILANTYYYHLLE